MRVERRLMSQAMLDDDGLGPIDLDVLAKQQPMFRALRDDQQAHGRCRTVLQDSNRLESTRGAVTSLLLGFVGPLSLESIEIFGSHIAGNVFAGKARRVEVRDLGVVVAHGICYSKSSRS